MISRGLRRSFALSSHVLRIEQATWQWVVAFVWRCWRAVDGCLVSTEYCRGNRANNYTANTIESVLIAIRSEMIEGGARLEGTNLYVSLYYYIYIT